LIVETILERLILIVVHFHDKKTSDDNTLKDDFSHKRAIIKHDFLR
jgi:hypothetical protein